MCEAFESGLIESVLVLFILRSECHCQLIRGLVNTLSQEQAHSAPVLKLVAYLSSLFMICVYTNTCDQWLIISYTAYLYQSD